MPQIYFPGKFVERCRRFIEQNPDLAEDVHEFIARCGRLGLKYLRLVITEEEGGRFNPPHSPNNWTPFIKDDDAIDKKEYNGRKVKINLPDKDYKQIQELVVRKLGITSTVTAWYMLCVFIVMMGYWQLPPKI